MASTYTWADAITAINPFIKSIPITVGQATIVDQLNSDIWRSGIWQWSIATLTSASGVLALVHGHQDYGVGTTTGAVFYRLWRVRISRTDVSPIVQIDKDITFGLTPTLDLFGSIDSIQAIGPVQAGTWYLNSALQSSVGLRLDRAASVTGSATYQIDGEYQYAPIKITSTASVIPFPDQYFSVAIEGLLYKYYKLGDDPRAGTRVTDGRGNVSYSGQLANYMAELQRMKDQEDLGDGAMFRFPESTLGGTRAGNFGMWGWY
mgnify:CR=1 FL=1